MEHRWDVPAEAAQIPGVRRRFAELAAQDGLSDEQAAGAALAVCEAATNAVRHGFPRGTAGTISLTVRVSGGGVWVLVSDDGVGPGEQSDDPGAGFGTGLMQALTSGMQRRPGRGGGTEVEMSFSAMHERPRPGAARSVSRLTA